MRRSGRDSPEEVIWERRFRRGGPGEESTNAGGGLARIRRRRRRRRKGGCMPARVGGVDRCKPCSQPAPAPSHG
jgi:hypothetical protein